MRLYEWLMEFNTLTKAVLNLFSPDPPAGGELAAIPRIRPKAVRSLAKSRTPAHGEQNVNCSQIFSISLPTTRYPLLILHHERTSRHCGTGKITRIIAGRIRKDQRNTRAHAEFYRAQHLFRDVERALQL